MFSFIPKTISTTENFTKITNYEFVDELFVYRLESKIFRSKEETITFEVIIIIITYYNYIL